MKINLKTKIFFKYADQIQNNIPSGVSIESASYMENNKLFESDNNSSLRIMTMNIHQNYSQRIKNNQNDEIMDEPNNLEDNDTNQLFDQDVNEEEDFEIPAFLRKQKF